MHLHPCFNSIRQLAAPTYPHPHPQTTSTPPHPPSSPPTHHWIGCVAVVALDSTQREHFWLCHHHLETLFISLATYQTGKFQSKMSHFHAVQGNASFYDSIRQFWQPTQHPALRLGAWRALELSGGWRTTLHWCCFSIKFFGHNFKKYISKVIHGIEGQNHQLQ